jgi:hypothetical protein
MRKGEIILLIVNTILTGASVLLTAWQIALMYTVS